MGWGGVGGTPGIELRNGDSKTPYSLSPLERFLKLTLGKNASKTSGSIPLPIFYGHFASSHNAIPPTAAMRKVIAMSCRPEM